MRKNEAFPFLMNRRPRTLLIGVWIRATAPVCAEGVACVDLSGHYVIENSDTHEITCDTTVVQTGFSEIKSKYVDGSGQFSLTMGWRTDGRTRADGPDDNVRASWLTLGPGQSAVAWTIQNVDPAPNPLQDSSDAETITWRQGEPERNQENHRLDRSGSHDGSFRSSL
jgi:hypothetical protein